MDENEAITPNQTQVGSIQRWFDHFSTNDHDSLGKLAIHSAVDLLPPVDEGDHCASVVTNGLTLALSRLFTGHILNTLTCSTSLTHSLSRQLAVSLLEPLLAPTLDRVLTEALDHLSSSSTWIDNLRRLRIWTWGKADGDIVAEEDLNAYAIHDFLGIKFSYIMYSTISILLCYCFRS